MSGYVLSNAAEADLEAIWDYTAETWSVRKAERYILDIREACDALASGSKTGRAADDIRGGYSKLPVGSHMLFYRLIDRDVIRMVRILHRRMDFSSHL